MRRFGVELELVGQNPVGFKETNGGLWKGEYYKFGDLIFRVGTDGSIMKYPSMELRTDPVDDLTLIPPLINHLRSQKIAGQAKYACGMHVHVDFPKHLRRDHGKKLAEYFNEKWGAKLKHNYRPHPVRDQWCCSGRAHVSGRYSALNFNSEFPTLEFRLFNCVLNSRYICRAIKDAVAITEDIEQYAKTLSPKQTSTISDWYPQTTTQFVMAEASRRYFVRTGSD